MISHVWLFVTPWTVAQAPLSMEFSRQQYWSGLSFSSPGDLPDPEIKSTCPALAGGFFTTEPPGKPTNVTGNISNQGEKSDGKIHKHTQNLVDQDFHLMNFKMFSHPNSLSISLRNPSRLELNILSPPSPQPLQQDDPEPLKKCCFLTPTEFVTKYENFWNLCLLSDHPWFGWLDERPPKFVNRRAREQRFQIFYLIQMWDKKTLKPRSQNWLSLPPPAHPLKISRWAKESLARE